MKKTISYATSLATMTAAIAAAGVLAATPSVGAPAAHSPASKVASATVSVEVSDTKLPTRGCVEHPYTLTVTTATPDVSWSADVTVFDQDYVEDGGDYIVGTGSTVVKDRSVLLCSSLNLAGTYELDVELDYGTYPYFMSYTSKMFRVEKQPAKIAVSLSDNTPRKGQPVRVYVRAWFSSGRVPVRGGSVVLQRLAGKRWVNYPWSNDVLNHKGMAEQLGRAVRTVTIRAQLRGGDLNKPATSRPVTMRVR